jgi:hypothetical protein
MDLKQVLAKVAYKIEPSPGGGFVARATDPSVPALEAPTREELQRKIQQNFLDALSSEFPDLKAAAEGKRLELAFHVERTPQGGFAIHSADPNVPIVHAATHDDLQSQVLEKLLNFAGKHVVPELSQVLAAQAGSANPKVVVNRKTTFQMKSGPQGITFGDTQAPSTSTASAGKFGQAALADASLTSTIDNKPITPESSSNWKMFGLFLLLLTLTVVMYFFLRLR